MKVFKFGGASVKDASSIHNVYEILKMDSDPKVVVISAMGKTTNALEKVVQSYTSGEDYLSDIQTVAESHIAYANELFGEKAESIIIKLNAFINEGINFLQDASSENYSFIYDQIVSIGELLSTSIVSEYLTLNGLNAEWIDIRPFLKTNAQYRSGKVNWDSTIANISETFSRTQLSITQGFIGSSDDGSTTTLGREGSDYTAAIIAHALSADSVTTWKDVPGILNADPRIFSEAELIPKLSYSEAIEMTYYGAKVIHPKTIQPLFKKNIPLYVKSFKKPQNSGTVISADLADSLPPVIVLDKNQVWLKIKVSDLSFIAEHDIRDVLNVFSLFDVKVNLLQTAALTLSVAITNQPRKLDEIIDKLKENYIVEAEDDLILMTIRHYTTETISKYLANKEVLIEQKTKNTIQCLIRDSIT